MKRAPAKLAGALFIWLFINSNVHETWRVI